MVPIMLLPCLVPPDVLQKRPFEVVEHLGSVELVHEGVYLDGEARVAPVHLELKGVLEILLPPARFMVESPWRDPGWQFNKFNRPILGRF